jgi:TonB-linked SusC/RagA family outer membrane protein
MNFFFSSLTIKTVLNSRVNFLNLRNMKMKQLLYAFVVPLLLFAGQVFGQERTVTGRVVDSVGGGIPNASVVIKGGKNGTQTGSDGTFTIKVPGTATALTISSVGFAAQDVNIAGTGTVDVTLRAANTALSEVVVIGYGTARRRDVTGSVAIVTSKDFQKGTISTPEQLIAGKVAGVAITSNGGQPGSGSTIRIRGGSSLSANNDPLIVIDGVPLDQTTIGGASNPLSFINPNDIESFTVLKDASSAAIYGSRAANGVIIITTKRGRGGSLRANFTSNVSLSKITKQVEVLDGNQVRDIVSRLGNNLHKSQVGAANTNWQNEIYRSAVSTDNNLSLTGGIKGLPYRLSLGYQYLTGVLRTDKLQKNSISLALNPTFFDNHLRVDVNLKGSMQKTRFANQSAIGSAVYFDPTQPVYANDKTFGGYFEWREPNGSLLLNRANNPVGLLNQYFDEASPSRSIGNITFDYKFHFLPELRANLNLGYDVSKNKGTIFVPAEAAVSYNIASPALGGRSDINRQSKTNTLADFYLNYVKDFAAIQSRIDVTAGYSYNNFQTKNYNFRSYNAAGDTIAGTTPPDFLFDIPENTLLSYFARANYSYNDKYLLTATVRRDGSSRFAKANRWGTFPSVSIAWRLKSEDFLKNSTAVSDLKIRAGYGVTGQQLVSNLAPPAGYYDYIPNYNLGNTYSSYQFGNQYLQTYTPAGFNSSLKWEQTATTNLALDYGFANGRISGSVDFYYRKTTDLLNRIPAPTGTNFSLYITSNVGSMENKGVEFNLNTQPVRTKKVTWDVNFNTTYNKNTITNLTIVPNDPKYAGLPSGTGSGVNGFIQLNAVGGPRSTFYLYKQVYDVKGHPIEGLFEDLNRDGIINVDDRYKGKTGDPNLFFGFSTNVSYGDFNAGFVLRSNLNNYVYNNVYSNLGRLNTITGNYTIGNASVNYLETGFAGNSTEQILSDYYIQNSSFLRMDNLTFGYNAGKVFNNKATLRLNAVVQNVFVITKYKGLDPEINGGIDNNFYPRPRTYTLGVNLDF